MKQSEARKHLENFLFVLQKFRSNTAESLESTPFSKTDLASLNKWLWGDHNPLPHLSKALERESIEIIDFYNFMTILHKFIPQVNMISALYGIKDFPEPNMNLFKTGWEPE